MTPITIYGKVNATHMNSTQSIHLEYHPSASKITHCQDPYHVLGNNVMIQRMIFIFIKRFSANQNLLYSLEGIISYKYCLHERVTWPGNCHREKTNVDRGDPRLKLIGFRGVTIFHVTLSCRQYLLYYTEC